MRLFHKLVPFILALIVVLIVIGLAGCATAGVGGEASKVGGDSLDQTPGSANNHVAGPASITSVRSKKAARTPNGMEAITDAAGNAVLEGDGSMTISGPNTSFVELDKGGFNQAGTGPSGHGAVIDLGAGQSMTFFSSTATTTTRKLKNADGSSEEMTIQSDPTNPTRAYGDAVLSPLVEYYKTRTAEQRAAFVAGVKANSETTKAIVDKLAGPEAWQFLTSLFAPVP